MVDYTREDFTRQDQQYDLILDAKTNRRIADYLRVLSPNGVYVSVGGETRRLLEIVLFAPAIRKFSNKRVHVLALKPNKGMDEINRLYEAGMIGPVIDGPHDFNDLPAAVQHFGSGKHLGKVVVEVRNGKVV